MVLSNYNMTARYKLHLSNLAVGQRFNKIVPDRPSHGTLTQQSLYRLPWYPWCLTQGSIFIVPLSLIYF